MNWSLLNPSVDVRGLLIVVSALLGCGLWLLLPRQSAGGRGFGAVLVAVALGLLGSQMPPLARFGANCLLQILAAVTVIAAVATVTVRSPVYSAIWFALSLLGTAGLFLFQGAQFLGVATVVVYAGAILVTFLFVLMLAQPRGIASYDRVGWEPALSAFTGAALVAILTLAVFNLERPWIKGRPTLTGLFTTEDLVSTGTKVLAKEHMATLGAQLFSRHLVAVEVAGTLLMVALVAAVAIVAHCRPDARNSGDQAHG